MGIKPNKKLILLHMTEKERFLAYYQKNPDIPIFYTPEWLDAVTGKTWDVINAYDAENNIIAFMPVTKKNKWGLELFTNPLLSPHQGIYFPALDPNMKEQKKQSLIFKACREILPKIGNPNLFKVRFHPSFSMWLPFYYQGYRQTTYYSYVLENIKNHDAIFEGFKMNTRNTIRRAEKKLTVIEKDDIELLYTLLKNTFEHKKSRMPFSLDFLKNLDGAIRHNRKLLFALDDQNNVLAGIFLAYDHNTAYNLIFGTDFQHVNSGAPSFLIWKAIQTASEKVNRFDFEGSRLPTIQPFFQSFGGTPVPYFEISKAKNVFWKGLFFAIGKI
jgi:hypothetical protein